MEFYETNAGKRFFDSQLPSLIRALRDMTEALNRRPAPVTLPAEAEDDFLKELYYGNAGIGINCMTNIGDSKEKLKEITSLQDELRKKLSDEQWELFETYSCNMTGYTSLESCRMFQHGFRVAVNLIVAGLGAQGES